MYTTTINKLQKISARIDYIASLNDPKLDDKLDKLIQEYNEIIENEYAKSEFYIQ